MKSDLRYQFDLTQGSYYQLVQYKYKIAIMYVSMLSNNKIKFIEVVRLPQPKMFPAFVWNIAISYLRHNLSCFPDIILEACGTHMFTNTKIISEAAFLFLKDIYCLRFKIVYATIILHLSYNKPAPWEMISAHLKKRLAI